MKTVKYFFYSLILVLGAVSFASCDDDDDKSNESTLGWSEAGNKAYYKTEKGTGINKVTHVLEMTFDSNNICESARYVITLSNNALAEAFYNELEPIKKERATYSGNTVIINTIGYAGLSRKDLEVLLEGGAGWYY